MDNPGDSRPAPGSDDIAAVISDTGASAPEVSRLGELAARIEHIEWVLLRRGAPPR